MNEDYLWDKTGEPDPQVQELEEILGRLKYKPRPLVIPADLLVTRRRSYRPLLAIAAALLFALLATGVWITLRKSEGPTPKLQAGTTGPSPEHTAKDNPVVPDRVEKEKKEQPQNLAVNKPRRAVRRTPKPEPEAEAAKEQIMLALRLASEKFNLASRKTQSPASNQIRNQHKIG